MIKQYRYAEISIDDIFHRTEEKTDVADAVAEILADVRKMAMKPCGVTVNALTVQNWMCWKCPQKNGRLRWQQ